LSSQRTTTHRTKSDLDQTSIGATPLRYPVGSSLSSTKFWYLQGWPQPGTPKPSVDDLGLGDPADRPAAPLRSATPARLLPA